MAVKVLVTPRTFGKSDAVPLTMLHEAGCEIISNPYGRALSEDEMIQLVQDVDGVIVGLDPMTKRVLEQASRLRAISKYGVGINNIDVEYATRRGIMVTNTPGANSASVAELTIGLLLAVCRRICASDRGIRRGVWRQYLGLQLEGKTIGIVGTGQIGKKVAEGARGLRMNVICSDIYPDHDWAVRLGAVYTAFSELISQADFISMHVPLENETYHLISHEELAQMKPSAIVINTARGGIIDEVALHDALVSNRIAGAALDVFEDESLEGSPLLTLENVVLTSHIGAHTQEAVQTMGRLAVFNLLQCLAGAVPDSIINKMAGDCCSVSVWART